MKASLIITALLFISAFSYSQDLVTSLQLEYTVTGPQYGASLMYETGKLWAFGGFCQQAATTSDDDASKDRFYGAALQAPLVRSKKLSFLLLFRSGFVNEKFFVIIPGLITRIDLGKRLALSTGMTLRKSYPALSSKLSLKLF